MQGQPEAGDATPENGEIQAAKNGRLPQERIELLEAIDGWTWDPRQDDWDAALTCLRAYVRTAGHARPPYPYVSQEGFRLGEWVSNRRQDHKRGRLSPERAVVLEATPGWVWDSREFAWQEGLSYLTAYSARTGEARPRQDFVTADGYNLGRWVAVQRRFYASGKLSQERIRMLEELPGWVWKPKKGRRA